MKGNQTAEGETPVVGENPPKTLTVGRLMEISAGLDPEALVLLPGFEGGLNGVVKVSTGLVRHEERGWYYGDWYPAREVKEGADHKAVALLPDRERYSGTAEWDLGAEVSLPDHSAAVGNEGDGAEPDQVTEWRSLAGKMLAALMWAENGGVLNDSSDMWRAVEQAIAEAKALGVQPAGRTAE